MMRTASITLILFMISFNAAAAWYGFCWGQNSFERFCNPVELKTPNYMARCRQWAKSHGAFKWGNKTGTSVTQLEQKQSWYCNRIIGNVPQPIPQDQYNCMVVSFCNHPSTPTSSIAMLGVTVVAPDRNQAIESCGLQASFQYLDYLKGNSKSDCYTRIDVDQI